MFTRSRPRRLVAYLLTAATVLGVAACSDDDPGSASGSVDLQQIRDATFAAGSARYTGQITFDGGASGPIEGTAAGEPAQGQVTFPVLTSGSEVQGAEATWVDDTIYVRRVVGADVTTAGQSLLSRADTDLPWLRIPSNTPLSRTLISPYDPFSLLAQLDAGAATLAGKGAEEVDGRQLDRYEVESDGVAQVLAVDRVELLVDSNQRLAGVRLEGSRSIDYDLSDYGIDVSATAPPDDQIQTASTGDDGSESPVGPYELVADGTFDGTAWQLMRAPATSDGTCWRLDGEGEVELDPVAATEIDGATCLLPIDPAVDEPVQIVFDTGSAAPFDAIVAVLPPGSQARLLFVDRSRQDVPVDPQGFLVWVGPKEPMAVVLQVTGPDGTQSECGPGSVSSLEDLDALPPDQLATLRDAPWLCLPA